jgi:hypothetical protein
MDRSHRLAAVSPIARDQLAIDQLSHLPDGRGGYVDHATGWLAVTLDGQRVASVAYRGEDVDGVETLVIVGAAGNGRGVDLTRHVLPVIERLAVASGFQAVRFHTRRPGLIRKAVRGHGYRIAETRPHETVLLKGIA